MGRIQPDQELDSLAATYIAPGLVVAYDPDTGIAHICCEDRFGSSVIEACFRMPDGKFPEIKPEQIIVAEYTKGRHDYFIKSIKVPDLRVPVWSRTYSDCLTFLPTRKTSIPIPEYLLPQEPLPSP